MWTKGLGVCLHLEGVIKCSLCLVPSNIFGSNLQDAIVECDCDHQDLKVVIRRHAKRQILGRCYIEIDYKRGYLSIVEDG